LGMREVGIFITIFR